jgi:hypothetical protein
MRRTRPVVNKTTADHPSPVGGAFSQYMAARRFPPPWSVEELDTCFVVRDHNGQQLAYVYFEDEAGRRSAAKPLTRHEPRRIAANIASCRSCCAKMGAVTRTYLKIV